MATLLIDGEIHPFVREIIEAQPHSEGEQFHRGDLAWLDLHLSARSAFILARFVRCRIQDSSIPAQLDWVLSNFIDR